VEHPKKVGDRSEAHVLAALVEVYDEVFLPRGENCRADFLVSNVEGILRVQAKTGRLRSGVVVFDTSSFTYHHPNNRGTRPYRRDYRGDADIFAVWCPDTDRVYIVPVDDVPVNGARLRVEPTRNGQAAGVRWARDYEVPRRSSSVG
jgi:hypothetical protein